MDWDEEQDTASTELPAKKGFGRGGSLALVLGNKVRGIGRGSADSGQTNGFGFGKQAEDSSLTKMNGFGGNRRAGGFSKTDDDEDAGFTSRPNGFSRGGFGGGFNSSNRGDDGGFNRKRDDDSGFNSRNRSDDGGFSNRRNDGGFNNRRNDGGFNNRNRGDDGGFNNRKSNDDDDTAETTGKANGFSRGGFGGGFGSSNRHMNGSSKSHANGASDDDDDDSGNPGFHSSRGGRGGFGANRPGRGGHQGSREGDWKCPDEDCGNMNFAFRKSCQKCNTDKPEGSENSGSTNRGSGFGRPGTGHQGSREGDWKCPDEDCGNMNFAFRKSCQKCNTDKPEDSENSGSTNRGGGFGRPGTDRPRGTGFGRGGDSSAGDRNSEEVNGGKPQEKYIPPTPSDKEEDIFNISVQKGINFDKYDDIPVEVSGRDQCGLINCFDEAGFFPTFVRNIKRANYDKPTPIQKYSIPIIMAGRDLMACAQTGSGKTAAFLLPVLTAMVSQGLTTDRNQSVQTPQAVCVAPTRELAIQIHTDCRKFAFQTDIRPVVLYGGTALGYQMRQIENGANIVIGTPGRLLDVINRGKISLANVSFLILDEADRMLDMGFEPEIRKLVETMGMPLKTERQTLMFSATFPEEIQKLAADFLNDYLFVTVGRVGGANTDVSQHFFQVERLQKREALCDILNAGGGEKTLVFVEMKRNADFLASYLCQSGFPTTSIHGDRLQREREEALADFKIGKAHVLVATSVAARGLDIPEVMHVINYDLPSSIDEYVHRIGRTGRCGNLGKATSFFSADTDQLMASHLVRILKEAQQEVPDWLAAHACGMGAGDPSSFAGRFGGKDIRRGKFGAGGRQGGDNWASGAGADAGDDENWD